MRQPCLFREMVQALRLTPAPVFCRYRTDSSGFSSARLVWSRHFRSRTERRKHACYNCNLSSFPRGCNLQSHIATYSDQKSDGEHKSSKAGGFGVFEFLRANWPCLFLKSGTSRNVALHVVVDIAKLRIEDRQALEIVTNRIFIGHAIAAMDLDCFLAHMMSGLTHSNLRR